MCEWIYGTDWIAALVSISVRLVSLRYWIYSSQPSMLLVVHGKWILLNTPLIIRNPIIGLGRIFALIICPCSSVDFPFNPPIGKEENLASSNSLLTPSFVIHFPLFYAFSEIYLNSWRKDLFFADACQLEQHFLSEDDSVLYRNELWSN